MCQQLSPLLNDQERSVKKNFFFLPPKAHHLATRTELLGIPSLRIAEFVNNNYNNKKCTSSSRTFRSNKFSGSKAI